MRGNSQALVLRGTDGSNAVRLPDKYVLLDPIERPVMQLGYDKSGHIYATLLVQLPTDFFIALFYNISRRLIIK